MNTRYNMIIIKGEIKTPDIISCMYNSYTKKTDVKFNNGKIGFSVLLGFITYIVTQLLVLLIVYILGLFNGNIMNLFLTANLDVINISVIKTIVLFAILIYLLLFVVVYIVNFKLFKKGVNVEWRY